MDFGVRYRHAGWGQGLTMLTCFMNMLPKLDPEDRARALYQGLNAVSVETLRRAFNRSGVSHVLSISGLHVGLVASAGFRSDNRPDWSRLEGEYARIPLGVGKIGRVGATGEPIVVKDFGGDPSWLLRYQWAAHQHIRGLNVQPIKFKDEMLGVLAIFTGRMRWEAQVTLDRFAPHLDSSPDPASPARRASDASGSGSSSPAASTRRAAISTGSPESGTKRSRG